MPDQFSDWQFIVLKDGVLWVDGVKKKSEEAARIVKAAIQAWNPEAEEGRGYLAINDDGEFVFHSEVDWR